MTTPNFHHVVRDHFLILVSYKTPVAALDQITGELFVTSQKYSVTTTRHIGKFRKFCNFPSKVTEVSPGWLAAVIAPQSI